MKRLLVYAPSWIGDAIMSLGAVRELAKAYPDATVDVLARPWVRELYDGCDVIAETHVYDARGEDRGVSGLARVARRLRASGFDACLVLPNAFRAAALVWAARIPERWGYATESRGFLLTRKVPPAPRPFGRHQAYYYLELLRGLGLPSAEPDLRLSVTDDMRARARALLEAEGWAPGTPLVGVHPGATNSRAKLWKPDRFAVVARRLAASQAARVVVLGGPSEIAIAREVSTGLDEPPLRLDGKTSLGELMGVLAELRVFLTNDSGPMHLASSLGVRTVAVFGPTDARETGPFGESARVVREPVDCSPCVHRDCPIDHRCMERVAPERVYEVASSLLAPVEALPK